MSENLTESIFNSKNNLSNYYPNLTGVNVFDLERKHLFYGRIDPNGDAIYLDDSNLKQIYGGAKKTHFAADFVSEAFFDLRKNIKKAADRNMISRSGIYSTNLRAHKAWDYHDLEFSYNQYLNKLYTDFVNNYLEIDRRHEKIKDHKSFVKEFVRYALRNAHYFPITKTGFVLSIHCSPFISGLMVEIASEEHGLPTNTRILKYVKDPNFVFFAKETKKYGFMLDKNAPWRLVFNLASGWAGDTSSSSKLTGGQTFMNRFGINYKNVFDFYYRRPHMEEILNIKNVFESLYTSFYQQHGTYEKLIQHKSSSDRCQRPVKNIRRNRQPPQDMTNEEHYEYWLKIILKLRFAETKFHHTTQNFNFFVNEMLDNKRVFGPDAALKYINDLTKGFFVSNFVKRGSFWGGMTETEYQQKKKIALEEAVDPSTVNYPLTATKNIK